MNLPQHVLGSNKYNVCTIGMNSYTYICRYNTYWLFISERLIVGPFANLLWARFCLS